MTRIVLSPATVARTCGCRDSSIASAKRGGEAARREDDDEVVVALDAERPAAKRRFQVAQTIGVRGAGRRVDEPPVRAAHLHEPELGDVSRDGGLDGVVAGLTEGVDQLGLGRDRPLPDQPEDRAVSFPSMGRHVRYSALIRTYS